MSKIIALFLLSFVLSACMATHPERMNVIYPENPKVYSEFSCQAIDAELATLEPKMDEWYRELRYTAELDRAQRNTMIILPPTTLLMAYTIETVDGPDALHFRHARGKESILHQEWRKKGCPDGGPTTAQLYQRALTAPEKADDPSTDDIYQAAVAAPKPAADNSAEDAYRAALAAAAKTE